MLYITGMEERIEEFSRKGRGEEKERKREGKGIRYNILYSYIFIIL